MELPRATHAAPYWSLAALAAAVPLWNHSTSMDAQSSQLSHWRGNEQVCGPDGPGTTSMPEWQSARCRQGSARDRCASPGQLKAHFCRWACCAVQPYEAFSGAGRRVWDWQGPVSVRRGLADPGRSDVDCIHSLGQAKEPLAIYSAVSRQNTQAVIEALYLQDRT